MNIDNDLLLSLYTTMLTIRRFEECAQDLYARGKIPGLVHLYIGEEAIAAGVCANLREDDYIVSNHRGHGHCIARGVELKAMMAELFGKRTGCCKGRGGSMHIADFGKGMLGANGVVGPGLAIGVGSAISAKYRGTRQVTVAFFGDGTSNTGVFHESLNIASLHKLPVVFVCENNLYAISVPQRKHQPIKDISIRALSYDMPGVTADGNDVVTVYREANKAIQRARAGKGPSLIEYKTYRWRGHYEGDPGLGSKYRPEKEIDEYKKKCPIRGLREKLIVEKTATEAVLKRLEQAVSKQIDEAVKYAEESPFSEPHELYDNIYVTERSEA